MGFLSQQDNANSFFVKTDDKDYRLEQDIQAYKDYANVQRQQDSLAVSNRQYRSFAIIPDIVAIDILTKYGMDIHSPEFMSDPAQLRRLKQIIETDYPLLKTSNIKAL
jgi:hypothetical protein